MRDPRVVLLNDTDVDGYHFGCARVMAVIRNQLAQRNIGPTGSVRVGMNWRDDNEDMVTHADLLVINGEGTLHHGSRKGRRLLEAAKVVKARGGKVALINALWQDNPDDWAGLVAKADILACRDTRSAAALSAETGRDVRCIGDLSMSQPIEIATAPRAGIIFGDSVHANVTARLATLAREKDNARLIPVTSSLKFVAPRLPGLRRVMRAAYARHSQRRYLAMNPTARFLPNEASYLSVLETKSLSVTGRFHAVCLAVATRTPFVAVKSNSWKIEALLDDIGLSQDRLQPLDALGSQLNQPAKWGFSPQEARNIDTRLAQ